MRVLVFTNMYPWEKMPFYGSFVHDEVEALRAAGVDVDVYFVNGRRNRASYLGMPFGFFRRIRARRYDVVHVHHSYCGLVATLQRRIPVVWTFHEGEISDEGATARAEGTAKRIAYSSRFKRFVASRVHTVIVVAGFLAQPLGRPDAVTLPSGIDTKRFAPMDRDEALRDVGLDPSKRYVLFPSTPSRVEKRYQLASAGVDELARREGNGDVALVCLDNVPHDRVPLYMNASRAMLMTSAFEASPVTVREALACDIPVVSTDVGDARSVLEGIDGCHVVDPNPVAIADALAATLARGGRVASRDRMLAFSQERTARRLVEIYRGVTGG